MYIGQFVKTTSGQEGTIIRITGEILHLLSDNWVEFSCRKNEATILRP